jgi:hypothetical protein
MTRALSRGKTSAPFAALRYIPCRIEFVGGEAEVCQRAGPSRPAWFKSG